MTLENQSQWCSYSPSSKTWEPEELILKIPVQVQEKTAVPALKSLAERSNSPLLYLLFYSVLCRFRWGDTLEGTTCLTQSKNSDVNFIRKYPHTNIQINLWPKFWALHWCSPLTHNINHPGVPLFKHNTVNWSLDISVLSPLKPECAFLYSLS